MTKIFSSIILLMFAACKQTGDTQSQGSDKKEKVISEEQIPALASIDFSQGSSEKPGVPTLFLAHPEVSEFASISICSKTSSPECKEYVSVREILFLNDLEAGSYNISAKSCFDASRCSKPISLDVSIQSRERGDTELYALPKDLEKTVAEVAKELKNIAPGLAVIPENACDNKLQHIPTARLVADLSIYNLAKFLLRPEATIQTEVHEEKQSLQLAQIKLNPHFEKAFDPETLSYLLKIETDYTEVNSKLQSAINTLARKSAKLTAGDPIAEISYQIAKTDYLRNKFNENIGILRQDLHRLHKTGKFLYDAYETQKSGKLSRTETMKLDAMMSDAEKSYYKLYSEFIEKYTNYNKEFKGKAEERLGVSKGLFHTYLGPEQIGHADQRLINKIIKKALTNSRSIADVEWRNENLFRVKRIRLTEQVSEFTDSESNCLLAHQSDILFGFYLKILENLGEVYKDALLLAYLDSK